MFEGPCCDTVKQPVFTQVEEAHEVTPLTHWMLQSAMCTEHCCEVYIATLLLETPNCV